MPGELVLMFKAISFQVLVAVCVLLPHNASLLLSHLVRPGWAPASHEQAKLTPLFSELLLKLVLAKHH